MLKFVSTLRNGSSRLGSKSSTWCFSNHQMIAACSSAVNAKQLKDTKVTADNSAVPTGAREKSKFPIISLVFDTLEDDKKPEEQEKVSREKRMVDDLLRVGDQANINLDHAKRVVKTLRECVENGKIKFKHFEKNPKYIRLIEALGQHGQSNDGWHALETRNTQPEVIHDFEQLEQSYNNVTTIPVDQAIGVLSGLAAKQRRVKPLLYAITINVMRSNTKLSVKSMGDILYGMALLKYPDVNLFDKLCSEIRISLRTVRQSPLIGSIVTSLGMVRYRDSGLLDMISEWFVAHKKIVRTRDLCALLVTLALVGYTPKNFKALLQESVLKLNETDMTRSSEWLDVVWSLTILNEVTPRHIESVLNSKFIETLADPEEISPMKQHKLLNINAAAKVLMEGYSGPVLPDDCKIFNAPIMKAKHKQIFIKSITDTLTNLFPSREHFRSNVATGTGFLIDIEFFLDKKHAPLPLNRVSQCPDALRIAIVANDYHDYCLGEAHLIGPVLLHYRLLQAHGYRLLDISHVEFRADDKLLTRITYLNNRIKDIVN